MIRVLARDPQVRDALQILISQYRLRIQCPAVIEGLALEPRIAPEADVTHFSYDACVPDKRYLHSGLHPGACVKRARLRVRRSEVRKKAVAPVQDAMPFQRTSWSIILDNATSSWLVG